MNNGIRLSSDPYVAAFELLFEKRGFRLQWFLPLAALMALIFYPLHAFITVWFMHIRGFYGQGHLHGLREVTEQALQFRNKYECNFYKGVRVRTQGHRRKWRPGPLNGLNLQ